MKKVLCFLALVITGIWIHPPAWGLTAISLENDDMSKWESFADNKGDKKTQIAFEKASDEKGNSVLKVKYFLDKDSWCGTLRHSMVQRWIGGKSVLVNIRGTQDSMVRISFFDANHVSYVNEIQISNEWKTFSIPFEKFKQNPYFQPAEAKKEKPLSLATVFQMQFEPLTPGNGIFYIERVEINGVSVTKNDNGVGSKSTEGMKLFENFETNKLNNLYIYGDKQNGAVINASIKTRKGVLKNRKNEKYLDVVYISGNGDYGCGLGFGSSLIESATALNVKGTTVLQVVAKVPMGIKFRISVNEQESGDGEKWTSAWQYGTGNWKKYLLPLNAFTKNIYAGNQEGDEKLNLENIITVEMEIGAKQGNGEIMVDDIEFQ